MCATCGCNGDGSVTIDAGTPHDHDDHHGHSHEGHSHEAHSHETHEHPVHSHAPGLTPARMVEIERSVLSRNDSYAARNREKLRRDGVLALNLLAAPGAGKTALLVGTLERLGGDVACAVIEGDQQTSNDAERIRATGVPAVQINTGKGCHLDAHQVGHAMAHLPLPAGGVLFIENVGNLVCPAAFDLGEQLRVTLVSVTEGEDKPLKYPDIFQNADLVLMTKTDLLPHLDFDRCALEANIRRIAPKARILAVTTREGAGMEEWLDWLKAERRAFLDDLAAHAEARSAALRAAR